MTYPISEVTRRVVYSGSAGTGPYNFSFEILDQGDIGVYKNTTLLTITTDYTVTINVDGTGYVTLVSAATGSDTISIFGNKGIERQTDFVTGGDLFANSLNDELDAQTIFAQQNSEAILRSLRAPVTDPTTIDMELPDADSRKGTVLGFNATTGNPEAGPEIADVSSLAAITADIATLADIEDGTDATDAIQTVAGISSNVTTVAGISSDVTTVSGISSDVTAVAADATDIGTVSTNITNVNTVAGISGNVTTVAGISSDVTAVAADATDIGTVAAKATEIGRLGTADAVADLAILGTTDAVSDMNTLAAISTDIDTVAGISSNVTTVATNSSQINTVSTNIGSVTTVAPYIGAVNSVSNNISNVNTVAGISADVTAVANISGDIQDVQDKLTEVQTVADDLQEAVSEIETVAASIANVNTVGTGIANVNTVAGISSNVTTVAGVSANVTTVAGISGNVTTVAGISSDVTAVAADATDIGTVATNIANVNSVGGSIADVNTVASNLADVSNFASLYRIGATDPTTSLDEGDLFYNTTTDTLKIYNGSAWEAGVTAGSGFLATTGGSMTGDVSFGDNDKAIFGAGSDLQIYHDGSNSYIQDTGTGNLFIQGESAVYIRDNAGAAMAVFNDGGAVQLRYNGSEKLATTSTGIDVTGTVTADGLTVDGGIDANLDNNVADFTIDDSGYLAINHSSRGGDYRINIAGTNADELRFLNGASQSLLRLAANGDISFYEDTGTTRKLYWDASAERLGIGTTSPISTFHSVGGQGVFQIDSTATAVSGNTSTTAFPHALSLYNSNNSQNNNIASLGFSVNSTGATSNAAIAVYSTAAGSADITFHTESGNTISEAMRIDSSGNLLVGTTDGSGFTTSSSNSGVKISDGTIAVNGAGATGYFNRLSTDGEIVQFRKDGTTVGSIGTWDGDFAIGQVNVAFKFDDGGNQILPWSVSSNLNRDNAVDLGDSTSRWKNLYLSGGVYLGGTGSANYLDDYEEGTFTPTLLATSTNPSVTYTQQYGFYKKVGGVVHAWTKINWSAVSGGSGSLLMGNLPFNTASTSGNQGLAGTVVSFGINYDANSNGVGLEPINNAHFVYFLESKDSGSSWANTGVGDLSSSGSLRTFMTYSTDS